MTGRTATRLDPENRLLWRFNRRRLDLEAMHDTLLLVSGRLDLTMQGRPVDVVNDPKTTRRTVYGLVDRQSVPAVFRAFDFASPDLSTERRSRTTVPQQALFCMNSPLVIEQARALAARPEISAAAARTAGSQRSIGGCSLAPPTLPSWKPPAASWSQGKAPPRISRTAPSSTPRNNWPRFSS